MPATSDSVTPLRDAGAYGSPWTIEEMFDHWHRRRLELDDRDVLSWIVIDEPAPPRLECFRLASSGPSAPSDGVELLRTAGHDDAELRIPDVSTPGRGRFHSAAPPIGRSAMFAG